MNKKFLKIYWIKYYYLKVRVNKKNKLSAMIFKIIIQN